MQSIQAMGGGQGNYYINLAHTDYFLGGGEPPGVWSCRGAEALGLTGAIEREAFLRAFNGFAPYDDRTLVQNAGAKNRQPGWDLTFSAPKSVSVLWSQVSPDVRGLIEQAHFAAVKESLRYLEENCAFTRRGKGGTRREPVSLVVATFEHGTSRAQDPQLHTHALVLNVGVNGDGKTRTIESKPLYQAKMLTGALYRTELARRLELLGYSVERQGKAFAVVGIPEALVDDFSKRRTQIEAVLAKKGKDSAQAAAVAALQTRTVKEHIARDILFDQWRGVAAKYGLTQDVTERLRVPGQERDIRAETKAAFAKAVERISSEVSHFSQCDLLRAVFEESQGRGLSAAHMQAYVEHRIETGAFVFVGELRNERRYTTHELFALEKSLLSTAESLVAQKGIPISDRSLLKAIDYAQDNETQKARFTGLEAETRTFNNEQLQALKHITQDTGQIAVISGMAGTGKTFLLTAARKAWETEGCRVLGTAVAGKATRGLAKGAGVESLTISRLLYNLTLKTHESRNPSPPITLNSKTILLVDEAGMVGTRQMDALVTACRERGAKMVLIGDARQLQPVEVGGPFRAIQDRIGKAELTEIVRQELDKKDKNPFWRRDAVRAFAGGRARDALGAYSDRGFLTISDTRQSAMKKLIEKWSASGIRQPKENLILAGTRAEVQELNRYAQEARRSVGKLGIRSIKVHGMTFFEKDRILITENYNRLGINNGDIGTITRVDPDAKRLSDPLSKKWTVG